MPKLSPYFRITKREWLRLGGLKNSELHTSTDQRGRTLYFMQKYGNGELDLA